MNELRRELMAEGIPAFEEAVLQKTLLAAQRARRVRRITRIGTATLAIIAAMVLWFPRTNQTPPLASSPIIPQAAPEGPAQGPGVFATIHTKPFAGVIRTRPLAKTQKVASSSGRIAVIRTSQGDGRNFEMINDEQLLSLFEGQAVALIGDGPDTRLLFLEGAGTR